ncbi:hypothetical protein [Blastococcus sp. TF02A-26]|uniref:hypothetical protein n=1 Tax=Blastococcus sp. TF02A-26 TaxID=2250577 RepID=UPI000DE9409D|nr:hypothetical protein [Blastococcus sp. TF02A-26]RBY84789.1 hypothetical protein DQ240_14310 [Blastococcus sp. TF02A-26]
MPLAVMDPPAARRQTPWLVVAVPAGPDVPASLVWALHEAARREATVLAVALVDSGVPDRLRTAALGTLDALVLRAVGLTGVHGRARTALMDPLVYQALAGTARGGDLVVVRPEGKTLLRPATPRSPAVRPLARTA